MTVTYDVNTTYIKGADYVRAVVTDRMRSSVPNAIQAMRVQWGLDDVDLPVIPNYDEGEPRYAFDGSNDTLIVTSVIQSNNFQTSDTDDLGAVEQQVRYRCRIYTYCRSGVGPEPMLEQAYPRVIRMRDMYGACVRQALLVMPSFGVDNFELVHTTLSEQYSDVAKVKGDRWVAALYHEFEIRVEEQVVEQQLATANVFDIRVKRTED